MMRPAVVIATLAIADLAIAETSTNKESKASKDEAGTSKESKADKGTRPMEVAYLAREHLRPEIASFASDCGVTFRGLPKDLLARQVDNRSVSILTALPLQNFTLANYFARDFRTNVPSDVLLALQTPAGATATLMPADLDYAAFQYAGAGRWALHLSCTDYVKGSIAASANIAKTEASVDYERAAHSSAGALVASGMFESPLVQILISGTATPEQKLEFYTRLWRQYASEGVTKKDKRYYINSMSAVLVTHTKDSSVNAALAATASVGGSGLGLSAQAGVQIRQSAGVSVSLVEYRVLVSGMLPKADPKNQENDKKKQRFVPSLRMSELPGVLDVKQRMEDVMKVKGESSTSTIGVDGVYVHTVNISNVPKLVCEDNWTTSVADGDRVNVDELEIQNNGKGKWTQQVVDGRTMNNCELSVHYIRKNVQPGASILVSYGLKPDWLSIIDGERVSFLVKRRVFVNNDIAASIDSSQALFAVDDGSAMKWQFAPTFKEGVSGPSPKNLPLWTLKLNAGTLSCGGKVLEGSAIHVERQGTKLVAKATIPNPRPTGPCKVLGISATVVTGNTSTEVPIDGVWVYFFRSFEELQQAQPKG